MLFYWTTLDYSHSKEPKIWFSVPLVAWLSGYYNSTASTCSEWQHVSTEHPNTRLQCCSGPTHPDLCMVIVGISCNANSSLSTCAKTLIYISLHIYHEWIRNIDWKPVSNVIKIYVTQNRFLPVAVSVNIKVWNQCQWIICVLFIMLPS